MISVFTKCAGADIATVGGSIPDRSKRVFSTASRPALELTQPPIKLVQEALSLGLKRPECEADHSPPSDAPPYIFMAWHLIELRDNLTLFAFLNKTSSQV
jgi:hypothetical protein